MKYLSVCSGIEAASVAWHPLGWEPVAFSEIEPFPSAVLAHHYPNVPNLGDMTKFQEWPNESVDLLVGGTPCQSFSVAGLRKGLEDPRGNLMLTYLAIAQRYRPRWVVWENVPGVLSSGGGRDFGTLLGALGELGYGWAYRVLDAQWFGVAQRRRRVFVVAHLGDAQRAAKVLFERESVQRNPAPSREARQGAAASVGGGTYLGNAEGGALDAPYLTCSNIDSHVNNQTPLVAQQVKCATGDITHALTTRSAAEEDGTGRGTPLVPVAFHNRQDPDVSGDITHPLGAKDNGMAVAQPIPFRKSRRAKSVDDHETWVEDGIANTLNCHDVGDIRAVDVVAQPVAFYDYLGSQGGGVEIGISPTLKKKDGVAVTQSVAQPVYGTDCYNGAITGDVAATLGTPGSSVNASGPTVMQPVAYGIDGEQNASEELIGTLRSHQSGGYEGARVAQPVAHVTIAPTLRAGGNQTGGDRPPGTDVDTVDSLLTVAQPVAFEPGSIARNAGPVGESPLAPTLRREMGDNQPAVRIDMQVRRLTPVECERLQGFPDGYTNIPWRKKPEAPDGPRYKALGNSMAVPCMAWIGKRIAEVDRGD